jgi:DNA-binding transcriptional LysR family regulator
MVTLGQEVLAPYCRADADGQAAFKLPGRPGQPVPYLGYGPGAYLGRITDLIVRQSRTPIHLERVYETDMAEGLRVMALEGHGLAFLPYSAVEKDVRAHRLVSAATADLPGLEMTMEVRAYRQIPSAREPSKGAAQALWDFLTHGTA